MTGAEAYEKASKLFPDAIVLRLLEETVRIENEPVAHCVLSVLTKRYANIKFEKSSWDKVISVTEKRAPKTKDDHKPEPSLYEVEAKP